MSRSNCPCGLVFYFAYCQLLYNLAKPNLFNVALNYCVKDLISRLLRCNRIIFNAVIVEQRPRAPPKGRVAVVRPFRNSQN